MHRRHLEFHAAAVGLRGTERNAEMSNWMSDGTMEAAARSGEGERTDRLEGAQRHGQRAPPLQDRRRVMCAGESNGPFLLALASRRDQPGTRHKRHDPRGYRHYGQPGQSAGPFGRLLLVLFDRKMRTRLAVRDRARRPA